MFLKLTRKIRIKMSENTMQEEWNEEISDGNETMENADIQENELSEIEKLKQEIQKEKDQYLRLFAEFDNFKKRTAKERFDIFKTANAETITSLIPVIDDFERGLKEIEKSENNELLKGVELIYHKLVETLRGKGLKAVEVKSGDVFDTDFMEAITQIPSPSEDLKGKVVDIVETGYALNDKIIRYAKVVIGQ